jgi:hypothetical protein
MHKFVHLCARTFIIDSLAVAPAIERFYFRKVFQKYL